MRISARIQNIRDRHEVSLQTNEQAHSITISPKPSGYGSSANGANCFFWRWQPVTAMISIAKL
jgi:hypothetical protein